MTMTKVHNRVADKRDWAVTILPMTEDTLTAVCDLHLNAVAGVLSARFGTRYVRAFMSWFLRTKTAIALVAATEDGAVVGYVIGAPIGYTATLNRELAWVAASCLIGRPWLLFDSRIRVTLKARLGFMVGRSAGDTTGLPSPAMSLVGIAVSPAVANRGVGSALMKGFESRARALKMASLRLSVYPDNAGARRLYERCGWQPLSQPPSATGTIYYGLIL